jgi:hypothetical protein
VLVQGQNEQNCKYIKIQHRKYTPERKGAEVSKIAGQDWKCILDETDVHRKVELLHETVLTILNRHCPLETIKVREDRPKWITPLSLKLIRARNKAYSRDGKTYKLLPTITQRVIRQNKRSFVNEHLNKEKNAKAWWKTTKELINSPKHQLHTTFIVDGSRLHNQDMANNLNAYYQSIGGERMTVTTTYDTTDNSPLNPVEIFEVKQLISKLDTSKATSFSDFPTWVTKASKDDICIPLMDIINTILRTKVYPSKWKLAQITPVPKTSHPEDYKDFRPIALLYQLGKLTE